MNYGKALAVIRAAKGLQQKELAVLLGVTSSYMSRIESGDRPMSTMMIERLAHETNIPKELILLLAQDSKKIQNEDSETIDRLSGALLKIILG